jgi:Asp-tRNA(Asn)/Glu-tRNA(Gln) amidotransferase C subunit
MSKNAKRMTRTPNRVEHLTREQVKKVANETLSELELSQEKLDQLERELNQALSAYRAIMTKDELPDANKIARTLNDLKKVMKSEKSQWFVRAVGRAYQRKQDPLRGYIILDDYAEETTKNLKRDVDEVSRWMQDQDCSRLVLDSLVSAVPLETLIAEKLPQVFEVVFEQACGNAETGPGARFLVGVAQAAGLHAGEYGTVASWIKKLRSREKPGLG